MLKSRLALWIFLVGIAGFCAGSVFGQEYPAKPVRMVAQNPGGSGDTAARLMAPVLSAAWGHQVIVDNRTTIGAMETAVKAPPDGYTILITGSSFWVATLFQKNLPYDPVRDFTPVTMTHTQPNVLAVHSSLPVKSVKELIALAKARPGELNFAEGGAGSLGQVAGLLFNSMAEIKTVPISYKGTVPSVIAILSGEVQLTFAPPVVVFPHMKSGRLRGLAVTSAQPSALVPGLPPVAATVPGYLSVTAYSVWAPAKTPAAIVNRLNQEIGRYLRTAEAKEKFFNAGTEIMSCTPEELGNAMRSELTRLGKVLRDAGIHPE